MIVELTTSIVFLVSAIYGGANGNTAEVASSTASTSPAKGSPTAQVEVKVDAKILDSKSIEKYVRNAYRDTPILAEVARCESTFNQFNKDGEVVRGNVNKADVGVMQINEKYHLERSKQLGLDIYTVEGNVAYAKLLYKDQGAAPWKASAPCWGKTIGSDQVAMR